MSCPVDFEPYTEVHFPVSLSCGHTISGTAAQSILDRAPRTTDNKRTFTCPTCRGSKLVTAGHKFPKNYGMLELMRSGVTTPAPAPSPPSTNNRYRLVVSNLGSDVLCTVKCDAPDTGGTTELFVGLDESGSMRTLVNRKNGLTRMCLVIYNMKMLLRRLANLPGRNFLITMVAFSHQTRILAKRTPVTPETVNELIQLVTELRPSTTTNIKAALREMLQLMVPGQHNIAVVLTDGQPTDLSGHVEADNPSEYQSIIREYSDRFSSISTIGYGYNLSHQIMNQVALVGGGVSSFGSDESMISNVFIRWVAWALTTVSGPPPTLITLDASGSPFQPAGGLAALSNGPTGQSLLLPAGTQVRLPGGGGPLTTSYDKALVARLRFCCALRRSIVCQDSELLTRFLASESAIHLDVDLIRECGGGGQIGMAYEPRYFQTWGEAYLWATLRGHEIGHQWNFKDLSLTKYVHPAFTTEVEGLDRVFQMMPAPTPSRPVTESVASQGGMDHVYNNQASTCFATASRVVLSDGEQCPVESLRSGMWVASYDPVSRTPSTSQIQSVIRTACPGGTTQTCQLATHAWVTPTHPILDVVTSQFQPPHQLVTPATTVTDYVYIVVLSRHHVINLDGVWCVTWGHGLTQERVVSLGYGGDEVVPHHSFGNMSWVVGECERIGLDREGYVTVNPGQIRRDPQTGWVIGLSS
jgi:hypothetical protein